MFVKVFDKKSATHANKPPSTHTVTRINSREYLVNVKNINYIHPSKTTVSVLI